MVMSEMKKRTIQFEMQIPTDNKRIDSDYYVEGYATTFEPYVLYRGENPIYEHIHREAFSKTKMDDVIFQFNHEGRVLARMSNGTLILEVDDHGLFIACDLSKTAYSREIYEDIKCGNVTKMSWGFFVAEDGEHFDASTRTINVTDVSEILDVSAVSIPANNQTSISARCKQFEEFERKAQELKEEQKRKEKEYLAKKLRLEIKLGGH